MKRIERRLGKFSIDVEIIHDNPDLVKHMLCDMIIVRAEHLGYNNAIEYIAYSDLFEIIEFNTMLPEYRLEVDENAIVRAVKIL